MDWMDVVAHFGRIVQRVWCFPERIHLSALLDKAIACPGVLIPMAATFWIPFRVFTFQTEQVGYDKLLLLDWLCMLDAREKHICYIHGLHERT